MSTGNNTGSNTPAGIPTADNEKAVGSHVAVIPAAGTAQTVNPTDRYNAATFANIGTNWVRAKFTFATGITGNASNLTQVTLIPPNGFTSVDFSNNPHFVSGAVDAIDAVVVESVALPSATAEASTLTAKTSTADATVVINFASA